MPLSLGALLGLRWAGAPLNGNGKIELSGYTGEDLAASAQGALHFECRRGAIGNQPSKSSKAELFPRRWAASTGGPPTRPSPTAA